MSRRIVPERSISNVSKESKSDTESDSESETNHKMYERHKLSSKFDYGNDDTDTRKTIVCLKKSLKMMSPGAPVNITNIWFIMSWLWGYHNFCQYPLWIFAGILILSIQIGLSFLLISEQYYNALENADGNVSIFCSQTHDYGYKYIVSVLSVFLFLYSFHNIYKIIPYFFKYGKIIRNSTKFGLFFQIISLCLEILAGTFVIINIWLYYVNPETTIQDAFFDMPAPILLIEMDDLILTFIGYKVIENYEEFLEEKITTQLMKSKLNIKGLSFLLLCIIIYILCMILYTLSIIYCC